MKTLQERLKYTKEKYGHILEKLNISDSDLKSILRGEGPEEKLTLIKESFPDVYSSITDHDSDISQINEKVSDVLGLVDFQLYDDLESHTFRALQELVNTKMQDGIKVFLQKRL